MSNLKSYAYNMEMQTWFRVADDHNLASEYKSLGNRIPEGSVRGILAELQVIFNLNST